MDFSRYLIATDLDGTFLGPDGRFVERNLRAVEHFKANGGLFTFSTGRVHLNVRAALGEPRLLLNAPCVMSNGAYLYDFTAECAMESELMDEKLVAELMAFVRSEYPDAEYRVSTPTDLRTGRIGPYLQKDIGRYDEGCLNGDPSLSWPLDDWYKIVFRGSSAEMHAMREALYQRFGDRLCMTASGSEILEVQAPGVNKATGLDKLRRTVGKERVLIACGDYENDIEMLQAADIAVCPENAMDAVKQIADFVLCHCKDGLIADVIEKIEVGEMK